MMYVESASEMPITTIAMSETYAVSPLGLPKNHDAESITNSTIFATNNSENSGSESHIICQKRSFIEYTDGL